MVNKIVLMPQKSQRKTTLQNLFKKKFQPIATFAYTLTSNKKNIMKMT